MPDARNVRSDSTWLQDKAKDLRKLSDYQREVLYEEIARRVLERHGYERMARDLGVSRSTIRRILRTDGFKRVFERVKQRIVEPVEAAMRDERMSVAERMEYGAQRALTEAFKLLQEAKSEHVRARVALSLLDRHPDAAPIRRDVGSSKQAVVLAADPDAMEALSRALTAAVQRGDVVEAEVLPDDQNASEGVSGRLTEGSE